MDNGAQLIIFFTLSNPESYMLRVQMPSRASGY